MAATDADARAAGFSTPVGTNLISGGDDAIRQNARVALDLINDAEFAKPTTLPGGDLDDLTTPGAYPFWSGVLNAPSDLSGTVYVTQLLTTAGAVAQTVQLAFSPSTAGSRMDIRFSGSVGWAAWDRLDAGDLTPGAAGGAGGPTVTPAGFKTVPLALTVGGGITSWSTTSGGVRLPVQFAAPVQRWRVHFRNINPREGTPQTATVSIPYVVLGRAGSMGYTYLETPEIATDLVGSGDLMTPWQNSPLAANEEYLLGYTWTTTASGTAPRQVVGGGWTTAYGGTAFRSNSAPVTATVSMPLDVWIEAEVAPDVPVVAAFGDSLASGVGATLPVFDSWLSQWCRAHGALPVHYSASGDTMAGWSDSEHYKWRRWQHLTRPDAAIHAMGNNDVFGGATLDALKTRRATTMSILSALVSSTIYTATITPRTSSTGAEEAVRRSYNTWLKRTPDAARDAFDFVPAISRDDENISPGFDSDGIHLNTAGYAAVAGTINRPVVYSPAP